MCKEHSQLVVAIKETPAISDNPPPFRETINLPWRRKDASLKDIYGLSFTLALLLTAYEGTRMLQIPAINKIGAVGEACEITAYITCMISLLFLPKMIIRKYGCKTTIVVSAFAFCPFILSAYHPNLETLLISSIFLGIGSGNLCTAVSTYLSDHGIIPLRNSCQEKVIVCHFGVVFAMIQHRCIWPNAISLSLKQYLGIISPETLLESKEVENSVPNSSQIPCEKNCSAIQTKEQLTAEANYILIAIYFIFCVAVGLFMRYFLDLRLKHRQEDSKNSMNTNFMATLKHPKIRDILLLSVITTFVGLQEGFMFEHFIKENPIVVSVGLEYFLFQFGMLFFGMYVFAIVFVFFFPRSVGMITATVAFVIVCVKASEPYNGNLITFFWVVALWTLTNAIFQIELCAMYATLFLEDHEAAFSNYFFWITTGLLLSRRDLPPFQRMGFQLIFLAVGMIGYLIVEFRYWKKKKALDLEPEEDEGSLLKEDSEAGSPTLDFKMTAHEKCTHVQVQ